MGISSQKFMNCFEEVITAVFYQYRKPMHWNHLHPAGNRMPLFGEQADCDLHLMLKFFTNLKHFVAFVTQPSEFLPLNVFYHLCHQNSISVGLDVINWHTGDLVIFYLLCVWFFGYNWRTTVLWESGWTGADGIRRHPTSKGLRYFHGGCNKMNGIACQSELAHKTVLGRLRQCPGMRPPGNQTFGSSGSDSHRTKQFSAHPFSSTSQLHKNWNRHYPTWF